MDRPDSYNDEQIVTPMIGDEDNGETVTTKN